jgi:hypothetical protein
MTKVIVYGKNQFYIAGSNQTNLAECQCLDQVLAVIQYFSSGTSFSSFLFAGFSFLLFRECSINNQ